VRNAHLPKKEIVDTRGGVEYMVGERYCVFGERSDAILESICELVNKMFDTKKYKDTKYSLT